MRSELFELSIELRARQLLQRLPDLVGMVESAPVVLIARGQELGREEEVQQQPLAQSGQVPFVDVRGLRKTLVHQAIECLLDHVPRFGLQVLATFEREGAQIVDDLPLLVHHVVVVEQPLPRLEVLHLDAFLGVADRLRDERVGDHLTLLRTHLRHHAGDALRVEEPHQVVLQGEEELGGPRVALPARATAQLPVDPPRLMPLGSDDMQAAHLLDRLTLDDLVARFLHPRPELDVGAPAGHVRRDRNRARLPRVRDDLRLPPVVLRVQHLVTDPPPLQHARQRLRHVHAHRTHQDRQLQRVQPLDLVDDRVVLLPLGAEDEVVAVVTDHLPVRGDDHDVEAVDLVKLAFLRLGGTGHSPELLIHPEVVLDGDRRERLCLALDRHLLLRLDGLVETVRPAAPRHHAAGELVDDHDLPVLHHVLLVLVEERVPLQELVDDVNLLALLRVLALERGPGIPALVGGEVRILVDPMDRLREVGNDERLRIVRREDVEPLVGEEDVVSFLVHREEHLLVEFVQTLLTHVRGLDLGHELLRARVVGEEFGEAAVLGPAALGEKEPLAGGELVSLRERSFRLGNHLPDDPRLAPRQIRDHRIVAGVRHVRVRRDGARDDERRARLVDEHRVDLVDDREVVPALDPLLQRVHHVVAQVIEAELVVRAVGDVREVSVPPLRRTRLVQVDAVDPEPEIPVEVAHPLRVALGQVRVDRNEVGAASGERVQVERHRRHQRLALAGRHLRDLPGMERHPADQLDVVGHHVPGEGLPGDVDLRPR